jgi:hypothetical protein
MYIYILNFRVNPVRIRNPPCSFTLLSPIVEHTGRQRSWAITKNCLKGVEQWDLQHGNMQVNPSSRTRRMTLDKSLMNQSSRFILQIHPMMGPVRCASWTPGPSARLREYIAITTPLETQSFLNLWMANCQLYCFGGFISVMDLDSITLGSLNIKQQESSW